ncbi:Glycosyltransferase involved in cell wall bisynthesis [Pseudomonas agarici]|nr:Glycosyltransferase involved in cell wall bisynthesis [Pseudomonas agarici]
MRIMHVTEALGGGVLNIIHQLVLMQSADDHEVIIAHSIRPDTPNSNELAVLFPRPIVRIELPMKTSISPLSDLLGLIKLIKLIKKTKPDIVHLHSSKAGVLGRLACKIIGRSSSCIYTPHGFSFLRKDLSSKVRSVFVAIERLSSYFGGTTIACSQSELEHAIHRAGQKTAVLVENSIPLEIVTEAIGSGKNCQIASAGRLCYQKNPSAFRELAIELQKEPASFLWIGDGDLKHQLLINGNLPANLRVTGWTSRELVANHLRLSDIFIMTSLWEGMPLALIEAQASGLPAIVLDVEGCKDIVIDGKTGFICQSIIEMQKKTRLLINDVALRKTMGAAARSMALERFSQDRMHNEILNVYNSRLNT